MNSLLLAFAVYFSLVLLNLVLDRIPGDYYRIINLSEQLQLMLFYNMILTTLTESYSVIALSCMIGLNKLSFSLNHYGETIQSASCIFALFVLIGYPLVVFWKLKKSWKKKDFEKT
jgi:hypothetical protein